MKAISSSLLPWLAVVGYATAQDAYLYNLDIEAHPASPSSSSSSQLVSIDSETANAILARRLGATASIRLGLVDDGILEHLNQYGGQQVLSPFEVDATSSTLDRLIFAIEGYDGDSLPASSGLRIGRANTDLASSQYITELIEKGGLQSSLCSRDLPIKAGIRFTYQIDTNGGPCTEIDRMVRSLGESLVGGAGGLQKALGDALSNNARRGMRGIMKMDITRVKIVPPERRNSAIERAFKGVYEVLAPWAKAGQIESTILLLPSQRAPPMLNLNRRQIPQDEEQQEAPLSQPLVSISSPPATSPPIMPFLSNSTSPLPAIRTLLPACFDSNDTCIKRTNSCSNHGTCYAKSSTCFACRCGSTIVRQDTDGTNKKTVYWGGSACEKKDVSVPFLLFAGFGIFMSAIVVGAVGMMFSMGAEELPSVIGAGVAGPRAQK